MFRLDDRQDREPLDLDLLENLLEQALVELMPASAGVEIEIVDDAAMQVLNEKFFSRPRPTNVISFPLHSDVGSTVVGGEAGDKTTLDPELLGVIVVSVETVKRETDGLGYGIEEGLLYYVIHGLLHLQGYEHVEVPAAEARRMEQRQEEIFESVLALQAGRLG